MTSQRPEVVLFVCVLSLQGLLTAHARQLGQEDRSELDRFITAVMRCGRLQAVGVTLVGEGSVQYEGGWGTTEPTSREAVSKDSVFCVGGSTQAFTSVLLATLLQRSNYTMDTALTTIGLDVDLPGNFRSHLINLKDILGMRTGLSNMDIKPLVGVNKSTYQRELKNVPEVKQFREDNVYSEAPFFYAEDLVRSLTNDTWYKSLRRYLLHPLGMDNAGLVHSDAWDKPRLVKPIVSVNGVNRLIAKDAFSGQDVVAAASSLCVSASDMSKWISFVLNKGKNTDDREVVSQEALWSTFQPVNVRGSGGDTRMSGFSQANVQASYSREANALGWIRGHYRGFPFVSQDGSLPGYESLTTILPQRNMGVFTAFTGEGGAKGYAAKVLINMFALDLLLQSKAGLNDRSACTELDKMVDQTRETDPRPPVVGSGMAARDLSEYEGVYKDYGFGEVVVKTENDSRRLEMTHGKLGTWLLTPTSLNDTFAMSASGTLWFLTGADGYREQGPHLATFAPYDAGRRSPIWSVHVPRFSRDSHPLFTKVPRLPARHTDLYCPRDPHSACAALSTSTSVLAASILMAGVLGRWR